MNSSTLCTMYGCYGTRCSVRHFCCVQALVRSESVWFSVTYPHTGGLCASRFFSRTILQTRCPYGGGATGGRRVCVFDTRDRYFSRPPRDTWTHALPRPVIKFPRYSVSSDTAATVAQRSDTTCAYDAPDSISAVRPHRPRAAICHIQL